jgi:hypothetical protein
MSFFDDILAAHVPEEADRAVILKYPELRTKVETIAAMNNRNQDWFSARLDADNKTFREKELEAALATANESLATAVVGSNDMTFEQIEAQLKSKGYVSKSDVDAQIAAAKTEFTQTLSRQDAGAFRLAGEAAKYANKHQSEFGEDIDMAKFTSQVASSLNPALPDMGVSSAYDNFVASKRTEKVIREAEALKVKSAADIEAAKQAGMEAGRQQGLIEAAQGRGGMPADQGGNGGPMGWMQKNQIERTRQVDADGNQKVPGGRLGDGAAAHAAYTQYLKDKAAGTVLQVM